MNPKAATKVVLVLLYASPRVASALLQRAPRKVCVQPGDVRLLGQVLLRPGYLPLTLFQ